jgi:hypothetical protein
MEKVIKWREKLRSRAIELARQVARKVQGTVFLVGSYARGDFMEDSDIDVLIIAQFTEPPHRRLMNLDVPPGVEVIALTVNEALNAVTKCYPIAQDIALGITLKDDLGIAEKLIRLAKACTNQSTTTTNPT